MTISSLSKCLKVKSVDRGSEPHSDKSHEISSIVMVNAITFTKATNEPEQTPT